MLCFRENIFKPSTGKQEKQTNNKYQVAGKKNKVHEHKLVPTHADNN